MPEQSRGYQDVADAYISGRHPTLGLSIVREWASTLPPGAAVLDLGCGPGVPLTAALLDQGCEVCGIDASARMVEAFRERFPHVTVTCEDVEDSTFFDRNFEGVLAWGVIFLLSAPNQALIIGKVARALHRGGQFLFTAPAPACSWADALSGQPSTSLGVEGYLPLLASHGLRVTQEQEDDGQNHYFFAIKD